MWWLFPVIPVGYLLAVRLTYGAQVRLGLSVDSAYGDRTAEQNTRISRLIIAWLWPFMLVILAAVGTCKALLAFVTVGWGNRELPSGSQEKDV